MSDHSDTGSHLEDAINMIPDLESSFAEFPIKPIQALKGCFDICEDDAGDQNSSDVEEQSAIKSSVQNEQEGESNDAEHFGQINSLPRPTTDGPRRYMSGSLLPDNSFSPKKLVADIDRDHLQSRFQTQRNHSGPLQCRQKHKLNNSSSVEDVSEGPVVQRKGRFKVFSADHNPKALVSNPNSSGITSPQISSVSAASVVPYLQSILQHNAMQREELIKAIKFTEQISSTSSGNGMEYVGSGTNENSHNSLTSPRERELQSQVIQLQQSIGSLVEQLRILKTRNAQLERNLSNLSENGSMQE